MELKVRIVAASYRREDVAVELFGRTEDNRSVTVLYRGFRPHFDVIEPDDIYLKHLKDSGQFVSSEEKKLWYEGSYRNALRIYVRSPWEVPNLKKMTDKPVLAADIPFHHRFIYDMDLGACTSVTGEINSKEEKNFTTEMVIDATAFSQCEQFNPPLKILSFDIENSIQTQEIYVIGYAIYDGSSYVKGAITGSEKEILQKFVELISREDPDILTGYNIDGYDLPLIEDRMKKHGVRFAIGRDDGIPRRIQNQYWRVHGRVISDTWWNVKKILHPKNESLNAVAKEMLGEGKDNINRLKIEEEWQARRQEVIEYCIKDAYLTLEIFMKLRVPERSMFMASVSKLPLEDVMNGGTSNYVDSILIREADRMDVGVPLTVYRDKGDAITGGYVKSIGAGIYRNVIVLDFKSMYPSMIIKYNICFTTLNPEGQIIAPNGIRFLSPDVRQGLIPKILKDLMQQRDDVKAKMKRSDPKDRAFYDGIQNAVKVLMNTFYGVLASSFYRFTNPEIGAAVTAFARNTITGLIEKLISEGNKVIYGDTDSIFIESGNESLEETVRYGEMLSEKLSREENLSLEFEKVFDPFFSHGAKKRYAGKIVYPYDQAGTTLVRGYEVRRTDSFDLQSEALSKVFSLILDNKPDEAVAYAREIVEKVQRGEGIPISKLVISRSVKDVREYEKKESHNLANVRVAKKMLEMGETFVPGMKVSWIVTNGKKTPQEVEPYIEGNQFPYTPDWSYYAKRLEETLSRVTEGIDQQSESRLGNKNGQVTLDSY